jgi:LacI family transcriptional regulator
LKLEALTNSWTNLISPAPDVIEQVVEEMGLEAVKVVIDAIENKALEPLKKRFPGRVK